MYRPTSPQAPLFGASFGLAAAGRARLDQTWATGFAAKVLPVLLRAEGALAPLYDAGNGRPNWSIARMLGILLLAEATDLTDQDALDSLQFDLRWQHALGLPREDAYLSRRSLVDFRSRLAEQQKEEDVIRPLFDSIAAEALGDLGVGHGRQRLDSTHILSNVRIKGRVWLFSNTLRHFLDVLGRVDGDASVRLPSVLRTWYADGEHASWREDGSDVVRRNRLERLAGWLYAIRVAFASDAEVSSWEAYALVVRVLDEQCKIVEIDPSMVNISQAGKDQPPGSSQTSAPGEGLTDPADAPRAPPVVSSPDGAGPVEVLPATAPLGDCPAGPPPPPEGSGGGAPTKEPTSEVPPFVEENGESTAIPPSTEAAAAAVDVGEASAAPAAPGTSVAVPPEVTVQVLPRSENVGTSLNTPFDPDVEYGHKGAGYHVQIAETCGTDTGTRIITDYDVTGASRPDGGQAQPSLDRLEARGLHPDVLLVDQGYTTGSAFDDAEKTGTTLHGPARTEGLAHDSIGREAFETDPLTGLFVRCPAGHPILRYADSTKRAKEKPTPFAHIDHTFCDACPLRERCVATRKTPTAPTYVVQDTSRLRARDRALAKQRDPVWWRDYQMRGGVESTNSELKRRHGLRKLRVRRRPRVEIAVGLKLTACNVKRWLKAVVAGLKPAPAPSKKRHYSARKAAIRHAVA